MSGYTCAAGCGATFPTATAASLHYATTHLSQGPRLTRPVSCWRCATYIPTTRTATTVTFGACPTCGWLHPTLRSQP